MDNKRQYKLLATHDLNHLWGEHFPVANAIVFFERILQSNPGAVISLRCANHWDDSRAGEISALFSRLETSVEFAARLEEERQRKASEADRTKESRKALYYQLKAEFEGGT